MTISQKVSNRKRGTGSLCVVDSEQSWGESAATGVPIWGRWRPQGFCYYPETSLTPDAKDHCSGVAWGSCYNSFFHAYFLLDTSLPFPWQLGSFLGFTEPLLGEIREDNWTGQVDAEMCKSSCFIPASGAHRAIPQSRCRSVKDHYSPWSL